MTGGRPVELHPVLAADLAAYAVLLADFLTASPASAASFSRFSRRWPENVITDLREHAALLTAALTANDDTVMDMENTTAATVVPCRPSVTGGQGALAC